jgi:chromosome segregation ATPase
MIALSVFFALAAVPASAQDPGQQSTGDAVADAARKARAEQKTAPKPKKVITNDDMPSAPAPAPAQAATGKGSSEGAAAEQASDKDEENNPKSEKYWRNRFAKLRGKLSNAEQELDVLQRELNKDELQYYNDPQKALMQQHNRSDINDKTAKVDAKRKEVESLKQQLSDLEDELRKAGGDPGWAR